MCEEASGRVARIQAWLVQPASATPPHSVEGLAAAPLSAPPIPFAIIAGGRGDKEGYNPLLPGDDDGVVTVDETLLVGARAFLRVDAVHTVIMNHPQTIAEVLRFLEGGRN